MFDWIADPSAWAALVTLTTLEIVLGIDNIIFISILADRLPERQRPAARRIGLLLAMGTRILLLLSLAWLMGLTKPLFELFGHPFSGRDLVLIGGGLFLLYKATVEIHTNIEGAEEGHGEGAGSKAASFMGVVIQIGIMDIIFSLDSVITAVGMADHIEVMVIAIVAAVLVMMLLVGPINNFISSHPTIKMLALAFLVLVGVVLIADGFGMHVPKGYVYFAMAFSAGVELLNLRLRARRERKQQQEEGT